MSSSRARSCSRSACYAVLRRHSADRRTAYSGWTWAWTGADDGGPRRPARQDLRGRSQGRRRRSSTSWCRRCTSDGSLVYLYHRVTTGHSAPDSWCVEHARGSRRCRIRAVSARAPPPVRRSRHILKDDVFAEDGRMPRPDRRMRQSPKCCRGLASGRTALCLYARYLALKCTGRRAGSPPTCPSGHPSGRPFVAPRPSFDVPHVVLQRPPCCPSIALARAASVRERLMHRPRRPVVRPPVERSPTFTGGLGTRP